MLRASVESEGTVLKRVREWRGWGWEDAVVVLALVVVGWEGVCEEGCDDEEGEVEEGGEERDEEEEEEDVVVVLVLVVVLLLVEVGFEATAVVMSYFLVRLRHSRNCVGTADSRKEMGGTG